MFSQRQVAEFKEVMCSNLAGNGVIAKEKMSVEWNGNECFLPGILHQQAFQMMDADKDGIIGKNDLRATFDALGRMVSDKELDELLGEATGPLNFTMLLTLFANRMSGSADDDEVIINAFKSFDEGGKIDSEK